MTLPIAIVGAGPVGLTTALGLAKYRVPFVLFEDDDRLSTDTKAGTTLSRTIEIFRRYGVAEPILERALRIDEIGEIERASGRATLSVRLAALANETRYPFVVNLPQHDMEPVLAAALERTGAGAVQLNHRLVRFEQRADRVVLTFATPRGERTIEAAYLLACDGGRSMVRDALGVRVEGESMPERYALVDLDVDLDVANPRDYPYLAYFPDPTEWMIVVRQPHCWRFLFPCGPEQAEPTADELRAKVLRFIGPVDRAAVLGKVVYRIHHRVATRWRDGRVFLMGDAAHLITPMWALGWNTGALDASNLPWRLAWLRRGWAPESILDGYEREQRPVAAGGSAQMAEEARKHMGKMSERVAAMTANNWGNAYTRSMLGVRLDVAGSGDWSMVKSATEPPLGAGDRMPDMLLHTPAGREIRLHDLCDDRFVALHFTDVRRRPALPPDTPALAHYAVSRWDASLDGGVRDRALLDPGDRLLTRSGWAPGTVALIRPDEHIAGFAPGAADVAESLYRAAVGASSKDST